jgi:tetratricopeptide (TPR) repeat protein
MAGVSCSSRPVTLPVPTGPSSEARLEAADTLVRAGCLDCLAAAYREYRALRADNPQLDKAIAGEVRTAALIDIRERELGLLSSDSLVAARERAAGSNAARLAFSKILDIVAELRLGPDGARPSTDEQVAAMLRFATNRTEWAGLLRETAPHEPLASYAWLGFACDTLNARTIAANEVRSFMGDTPSALLTFGYLASCERGQSEALALLLDYDPRFVEANYLLGLADLGGRPQPDVDGADQRFRRAYQWRQDWPALTLSMANLALATEDYDRALQFFDRTLTLRPSDGDSLVGTIHALTQLGRYRDALVTVEALLATGRNVGEARYWRAFNENQIGLYEAAWSDVQIAATLLVNAQVPKLAGIIAYRRGDLEVARRQLEDARGRNRSDCEVGFYLHMVLADRREWSRTAEIASETGRCFDEWESRLRDNIAALRESNGEPARVARQIARREDQIATNARMQVTAWFNTAVAMFNLGRHAEARTFAMKVVDDQQFGDRARALLPRLRE